MTWVSAASLLLVAVVSQLGTAQQLYEGSQCTTLTGTGGVCRKLNSCTWAVNEVRKGRRPKVCRYAGPYPVVCCPTEVASSTAKPAVHTLGATAAPAAPAPAVRGRIAREKCNEYASYVFSVEDSPILMPSTDRVDKCASSAEALIVGGSTAKAMEYPHMALLGYGEEDKIDWWCGGSLISPDFVLTAGHCLISGERPVRWVLLGELDRSTDQDDDRPQTIEVAERIKHPDYHPPSTYNDIALLRLQESATMSGYVRPACLHTEPALRTMASGTATTIASSGSIPEDSDEEVPIATGWGNTDWEGEASNQLMKVPLMEATPAACARAYASTSKMKLARGIQTDFQLCAGGGGKDTCQGDSGGPLQLPTRNYSRKSTEPYCMHKIVGVTSFGQACGFHAPGVYSRVYYYVPWIEKIVWPGS